MKTYLLYFESLIIIILFSLSYPEKSCASDMDTVSDDLNSLQEAIANKDHDSAARICLEMSESYVDKDGDSLLFFADKGLKLVNRDSTETYIRLLNMLAEGYFQKGEIETSIEHRKKAINTAFETCYDTLQICDMMTVLGISYRRMSMIDSAITTYNRANELLKGDSPEVYTSKSYILSSIAILYSNIGRSQEAETFADQAFRYAQLSNDPEMIIASASSAGAVAVKNGNAEKGSEILKGAYKKALEFNEPKYEVKILTYIISMFSLTNQPDSIYRYMPLIEEPLKKIPANTPEALGYKETQASVLYTLGRHRESNEILSELLTLSNTNSTTSPDIIHIYMARNYSNLKDLKHAAEHYEKAYAIADSIYQSEVNQQLSEWSVKYDTQKKELEIAKLEQEHLEANSAKMRIAIIGFSIIFILILIILYSIYRNKKRLKEEDLKIARSYIEGLEKERSRLASDLHDGACNDILAIGYQIMAMELPSDKQEKLLKMTEELRSEIRYISHELMPPKFKFASLDETLEAYTSKLSAMKSVDVSFSKKSDETKWSDIPEQISYEIYRLTQEIVSNILVHSGATCLDIELTLNHDNIFLAVSGNGRHYNRNEQNRNGGIGWTVIEERLKKIKGELSISERDGKQLFTVSVAV